MLGAVGSVVGMAAGVAGGAVTAAGYKKQAAQMRVMRQYNWDRRVEQAAVKQSEGGVAYAEKAREGELAAGTARAGIAEMGGSTTSSGGLMHVVRMDLRKDYLAATEQFKYLDEERNIRNQAKADWYEANIQIEAAETKAKAAMIGGFG